MTTPKEEAALLAVTDALRSHGEGDGADLDRVIELAYRDLRRIAHLQLRHHHGNDLQTTALVNELYLRLVRRGRATWRDRSHFYAASATAMRHILIDAARRRRRQKRGGLSPDVPLAESIARGDEPDAEWLVSVDHALEQLTRHDPRMAKVFECRYFAGYSSEETAEILGLSRRTAQRDWTRACAWLRTAIDGGREPDG